MGVWKRTAVAAVFVLCAAAPAFAGPPYITDDPEPTDTGHFENYLFVEGSRSLGRFAGPAAGIEVNYGAFEDTQLTWSVPLNPNPGPTGMGVVWAPLGGGIKYRFIEEDDDGWRPQVAFFPQVYIPVGSAAHTTPTTELLPIWIQKSFGAWQTFGGGGYLNNPGAGNRSYMIYGWALQNQITDTLALGAEVFGQTRSAGEGTSATAIGFAALYDLSEQWHIIGSINAGVVNARENDGFSYNLALKWTI